MILYRHIVYIRIDYMTTKIPERPRALGRSLNFASGACNSVCQALLDPHGITLAQWVILSALWREDQLTVADLASYSGNAAPATSRIVDRMAERGLVSRQNDPKDRRAVRVVLTQKGQALDHLAQMHEMVNTVMLDGISEEDASTLFALLERTEANARAWSPKA